MVRPSPEELYRRARSYLRVTQVILESKDETLLQNALENIHLAVELSLKSVLGLKGKEYPTTHDLAKLIDEVTYLEFNDENACPEEWITFQSYLKPNRELGKIIWTMDCRYFVIERSSQDLRQAINDYERFYQWTHKHWLTKFGECLKI